MSFKVENLTIQFVKNLEYLFQNLSFEIREGEILTLMGPSGSGKSTLLSYLCGTISNNFTTQGKIFLEKVLLNQLEPEKRKIGLLYQSPLLFPHLNIYENLSFGIAACYTRAQKKEKILQCLQDLEMEGFGSRFPQTLSGGQQARIALMRTILSDPRILLLDEPFSKLDSSLKQKIRELVFLHAKEKKLPTLLVTHSMEDAKAAGGKIIEL
jgi:putative thiamine transport system ATP-binding protein